MKTIKIEHGVPIPPTSEYIPVLKQLKIGDSFFLPNETTNSARYLYILSTRLKIKLTARSMDGGVRVWRIK